MIYSESNHLVNSNENISVKVSALGKASKYIMPTEKLSIGTNVLA